MTMISKLISADWLNATKRYNPHHAGFGVQAKDSTAELTQ